MTGDGKQGSAGYDAVVVHYANDAVYGVVAGLLNQLPPPRTLWVVDNSGDLDHRRMAMVAPAAVVLPPAGNRGYAAAVNSVRPLVGAEGRLLVLTHEVELAPGCAASLLDALRTDSRVGSAGPVLRLTSDHDRAFSTGGTLDRWAWPRHREVASDGHEIATVTWTDGSVLMLRLEALHRVGWLDEEYFLYFEEIDLALRLRRDGWATVVVGSATAYQEPGEYPPFLAVRNRVRLVRMNSEVLRVPFPALLVRIVIEIVWVARRRGLRSLPPSLRGLIAGVRGESGRPRH